MVLNAVSRALTAFCVLPCRRVSSATRGWFRARTLGSVAGRDRATRSTSRGRLRPRRSCVPDSPGTSSGCRALTKTELVGFAAAAFEKVAVIKSFASAARSLRVDRLIGGVIRRAGRFLNRELAGDFSDNQLDADSFPDWSKSTRLKIRPAEAVDRDNASPEGKTKLPWGFPPRCAPSSRAHSKARVTRA